MSHPVIVAGTRSAIGTAGRSLAGIRADQLAGPVLAATLERSGLAPTDVTDVVLGNCMGPGGDVARSAALLAGLPAAVPALTVDRQCASGLAAIDVAVSLVRGGAGAVLAGGVESVSTAPWRHWPPVDGADLVRYERAPFAPEGWEDPEMGLANDLLAQEAGVTRERQDEYAARSHARAVAARDAGAFDAEVVAVAGVTRDDLEDEGVSVDQLASILQANGVPTSAGALEVLDELRGRALVHVVAAHAEQDQTHDEEHQLGADPHPPLRAVTQRVEPQRLGPHRRCDEDREDQAGKHRQDLDPLRAAGRRGVRDVGAGAPLVRWQV